MDNNDLPSNGFLTVLQRKELNDGLLSEASERLSKAVLLTMATGKKASVTLTLTIEPQKGRAVNVSAAVTTKLPPVNNDSLTIFYPDDQGGLHRNNPAQKEMAFEPRSIEGGREEETPVAAQEEASA